MNNSTYRNKTIKCTEARSNLFNKMKKKKSLFHPLYSRRFKSEIFTCTIMSTGVFIIIQYFDFCLSDSMV